MDHPETSSTAAQAMASDPSFEPSMSRSVRMRASTGKAVMLRAAPMKSAKPVKVTLSLDNRGYRTKARKIIRVWVVGAGGVLRGEAQVVSGNYALPGIEIA